MGGHERGSGSRIEDPEEQMEGLKIAVEMYERFPSASKVQQARKNDSRIPNVVALRRLCKGFNNRYGWPAVEDVYAYWKENGELPEDVLDQPTTEELLEELSNE